MFEKKKSLGWPCIPFFDLHVCKAWEYWEPDTDSEEEGDPIVPRDNPEFLAMEADLKERKRKQSEKAITAEKCRQRGNQCMSEGDFVGAIENYDEGLEYRRDCKALWTNKALAELKVFRSSALPQFL